MTNQILTHDEQALKICWSLCKLFNHDNYDFKAYRAWPDILWWMWIIVNEQILENCLALCHLFSHDKKLAQGGYWKYVFLWLLFTLIIVIFYGWLNRDSLTISNALISYKRIHISVYSLWWADIGNMIGFKHL